MPRGTVLSLHRWPVKSMAGERLDAMQIGPDGVVGDRAYALWIKGGKKATAMATPGLLDWSARYDGAPGEPPLLTAPDGTEHRWSKENGLAQAVSDHTGRDLALSHDPAGHRDVAGTVLVTLESSRRLLEEEVGAPVDIRRFRTNLHLDLDGAPPFDELTWEGRTIKTGDAELVVDHLCDRCTIVTRDPEDPTTKWGELLRTINKRHETFFGVRARVTKPGTVRAGDAVELG